MEAAIGIKGSDYVIIATDGNSPFSVLNMHSDTNKFYKLGSGLIMSSIGEQGDQQMFGEYIAKNMKLYEMRHGYPLAPSAAAFFVRNQLATAIRSRNPYLVHVLLAGFDESEGAQLYWMDYLGTLAPVPWGAHGYANMFTTGLIDKEYREDMSRAEAYQLLGKCLHALHQRFIISIPKLKVRVVSKDGIEEMPDILLSTVASSRLQPSAGGRSASPARRSPTPMDAST